MECNNGSFCSYFSVSIQCDKHIIITEDTADHKGTHCFHGVYLLGNMMMIDVYIFKAPAMFKLLTID
jgi:hypothetical protein